MGIFNKEKRDPFYDVVPPGGEYRVDSGEVFVRSDGSTFTITEAMELADRAEKARLHEKPPNRLMAILSLRGLNRIFHKHVDIQFDGLGSVAREGDTDSALGTLAQLEINNLKGRPADVGLYPGQLDDPNAP